MKNTNISGEYQMTNVFKEEFKLLMKTWIKYQEDSIDNYCNFFNTDLSSEFELAKIELLSEIQVMLDDNKIDIEAYQDKYLN